MTYTSKTEFLSIGLPEEDLELSNGMTIRIRSLARKEMHDVASLASDSSKAEKMALMYGIVEPKLTGHEIDQLMASTGAQVLSPVVDAIIALSGMSEEDASEKASFPQDGDD